MRNKNRLHLRVNSLLKALAFVSPFQNKIGVLEYPKSGGSWLCGALSAASGYTYSKNYALIGAKRQVIHSHRHLLLKLSIRTDLKILLVRNPFDTYLSLYFHSLFYNDRGNRVLVDSTRKAMGQHFLAEDFSYTFSCFLQYLFDAKLPYLTSWSKFHENLPLSSFVLLKYEDLWDDMRHHLILLLDQSNKDISYSGLDQYCAESRRQIERSRKKFTSSDLSSSSVVPFVRRGGYGGWMESLNSDHIDLILSDSSSLLSVFGYQNILEDLL